MKISRFIESQGGLVWGGLGSLGEKRENSAGQEITVTVVVSSPRPFIAFRRLIDGRID